MTTILLCWYALGWACVGYGVSQIDENPTFKGIFFVVFLAPLIAAILIVAKLGDVCLRAMGGPE